MAAACVADDPIDGELDRFDASITPADAALVLALVNDPRTDITVLDDDAALNRRAATHILAHRDGADGAPGTADDDRFDSLAELDAVPYVGPVALAAIRAYAVARAPGGEVVEGVAFTAAEAGAVVWGVNRAIVDELDIDVGLDARAARNLVAAAPYATVTQMGAIGYVGPAALDALRMHAAVWIDEQGSSPATCEVVAVPIDVAAVRDYQTRLNALVETAPPAGWTLAAYRVPACTSLASSAHIKALRRVLIDHAGWTAAVQDAPELFAFGGAVVGALDFVRQLSRSLDAAADARDDRIARGDSGAAAAYAALAQSHAGVVELVSAHPETTLSFDIFLSAAECSERAALVADLTTGIVVAIHARPGC